MPSTIAIVLPLAALMASILSGIIGMGGGILLLAVMLSFLEHGEAIPLHAVVQLASNTTRAIAFRRSTDLAVVARFALGMLPGAALGTLTLYHLGQIESGEPYLKIMVGLYVLGAPFMPIRKMESSGSPTDPRRGFVVIGFLVGLFALAVGAVGPLIAPIFTRNGYVKERLIATKAACQVLTHFVKLPAFLILHSFDSTSFSVLMLMMVAAVIPGTLLGKYLLRYVSPKAFVVMFKVALVVAGLKVLFIDGILKLT